MRWAVASAELTLDPEVQLVGDSLALGVKRGAGVAAAAVPRHLLQHQALVAVEHARWCVVHQLPLLQQTQRKEFTTDCKVIAAFLNESIIVITT